ncbi:NAD(P)H-dependent flavin oxidoreductase [Thermoactinomyces mirandus]|uniref:Probable nitronate monooxygenase n=1 Tax=Thermoactinomyces mirandus TaxID=2756294 RepID=A0A7W2AR68_9BACL|nr:nitronate monooxygenase [Thermoactinomyces mirandus]MBA4602674.1 nitronate monooxygenase [Thermoactinomyces mirandus]
MQHKLPSEISDQLVLPVIAAPMFLVSGPDMVIESCKAGIIGSFPLLNARTTDILDCWMKRITSELEKAKTDNPGHRIAPWAVNLVVHRTNQRYRDDLELIRKYKPPIVITSLGDPAPAVKVVHKYNGLVFSDVIKIAHAKKAVSAGVDGLVLVSSGAGGHGGTINPFAFIGEVRKFWDGITLLAGCLSSGRDILAAQLLGADLAYMGTRFIPASESTASENYKQMVIDSTLEDVIYTDAFSGVNANYLKPSIRKAGLDLELLERKETMDFSVLSRTGSKVWKDIWSAGQGVGCINRVQTIAEIVDELKQEYEEACQKLSGR